MKAKFIKPKMVRILNSLSIDTVKIPNKDYAIGKYPITIAEYMHFARDTNSHYPEWIEDDTKYKDMNLNDNAPIIGVSWYDAVAYCAWLSEKTGKKYRLPLVEEEWVYAVNQDEEGIDSFGNAVSNADDYAWFYDNSGGTTHNVGENNPYSLGIYDMYGNVREWTDDTEDEDKAGVCGGSWKMSKYDWHFDEFEKNLKSNDLGFRIVLEIEKQEETQKKVKPHVKLEKEIVAPKLLTKTLDSNLDFVVGRETDLKSIDSLLENNNKILITGMGGIGKTTLTSMYLKKVENNYDYLGYIRIEKDYKQSIISTFANALDINEDTTDNMYDMVIYKLNRLKGKKLIVIDDIDNVDDFKILNEFFNALNSLKIILVSRNGAISDYGDIAHLFIDKLSYKDAKKLLKAKVQKNITNDTLELILGYLNYSPFVINVVSNLIDNGDVPINYLLEIMKRGELNKVFAEWVSKYSEIDKEKIENIEQHTVCQMLGTSYFIKIILSEKDKKKMSGGYVYIDIRDYGIDGYLKYPSEESTTSHDIERFKNILNSIEKKNWEIEINCSGMELQESMGVTYLTSKVFEPFKTEKDKEDYLKFLAIESEIEAWLSENYIEMEDELTYDAYGGKYQHIRGGTSDLEEILYSKFKNIYPQEYVDRAIKTINQAYGDKDFNQVMYSKEDDATPDISYFTKEYSHKIDEVVKWVFENYEDPISLTSDVLKEILVVEFKEKYSNDFIEKIIESIKLEYGEVNKIDESDKGFLNIVKRNGKIETLDVTKFQNYVANVDAMATREELHKKHKEWLAKKNKNLDILRGKKDKKK